MPTDIYHPLNPAQNKPWNDPATFWVLRIGSETNAQLAARIGASSSAELRLSFAALLLKGTLVSNPNVATLPIEGPAWLGEVRYSYNPVLRSVAVESQNTANLRFARTDGQPLAGLSPDGQALTGGIFYQPGPLSGQALFVWQWGFRSSATTGSGILPNVSLTLTFRNPLDNAEFNVLMVPAEGLALPLVADMTSTDVTGDNADYVAPGGGGGAVNQPPTVAAPIAEQTGVIGTAYSLVLPIGTFVDADGSIAGVAVAGLPAGLTYSAATRTISGTPTTAGTSTITATATDNAGASVTDSFNLTVAAAVIPGNTVYGSDGVYAGTVNVGHQTNLAMLNLSGKTMNTVARSFEFEQLATPVASNGKALQVMINTHGFRTGFAGVFAMGWPYVVTNWDVDPNLPPHARRGGNQRSGQSIVTIL